MALESMRRALEAVPERLDVMQFDNKASRTLGGLGRRMRRAEMNMAQTPSEKWLGSELLGTALMQPHTQQRNSVMRKPGLALSLVRLAMSLARGVGAGIGEMNRINQRYGDGLEVSYF